MVKLTVRRWETPARDVLELPYDSYRDQVLPFLEPEILAVYQSPDVWESMQTFVARKLEGEDEDD